MNRTNFAAALSILAGCSATTAFGLTNLIAVPYLGAREPYFLGSGVAGGGGDTKGNWNFLIGPDYTSPNFISSETLSLVIDGNRKPLSLDMHRCRQAGVFFGIQILGDLKVTVADFTNGNSPWVARLIRVENGTAAKSVRVSICASVTPATKSATNIEHGEALNIALDKTICCFGSETKNWATRTSVITFSQPCSALPTDSGFEVKTTEHLIAPGTTYSTALYHYQHYDEGLPASEYVAKLRRQNPEQDLDRSLGEWKKWLRVGRQLDRQIPRSQGPRRG